MLNWVCWRWPFWYVQASGASKTRRAMFAGAVVLALATVAAVAMIGGEAVKTGQVRMELSDRNEFESQPAWYSACLAAAATYRFAVASLFSCCFLCLFFFCTSSPRQNRECGSWVPTEAAGRGLCGDFITADAQPSQI